MKKTILTLSFILLVTFAWAQGQRGGGQRPQKPTPEEMIKQATKELNLTDEQVKQWIEIHEKYESSASERSQAQEARQAMGKELEATLTKEQLEKFIKMRESRRPPGRGN